VDSFQTEEILQVFIVRSSHCKKVPGDVVCSMQLVINDMTQSVCSSCSSLQLRQVTRDYL